MRRLLFVAVLLALSGCASAPALPTALPTTVPTTEAAPTQTALSPTRALETSTPRPSPTTPPATATSTATPIVAPVLSITAPPAGSELPLGGEVVVGGYGYLSPELTVKVGLVSATGWSLTSTEATVGENGWEATLSLPTAVSGAAMVQAIILNEDEQVLAQDNVPVILSVEHSLDEPYLTLARPTRGEMGVGGHSLLFDGRIQQPGGGQVVLSVWAEDCQTEVAQYAFNVSGSTPFLGYVFLPEDVSGPACAVASIGEPGEEGWLVAQMPVTLRPKDDPGAVGVVVANPRSGRTVSGGEELVVNGLAYNAPQGGVLVQVALPNGQVIDSAALQPDSYGRWETTLDLPADLDGQAIVQAVLGTPEDPLASAYHLFTVVPGEEPTGEEPADGP